MRTTRLIQSADLPLLRIARPDDTITVLHEIVAQLAERVELLEAREHVTRATLQSRHRLSQ